MLSMPVFDIMLLLLIQFFVYNSRIYCKHTSLFAILTYVFGFLLTCIRHYFPRSGGLLNRSWRCAREFHPSEDLSELSPLPESCGWTGAPVWMQSWRAACQGRFWMDWLARHLMAVDWCGFPHRWVLAHPSSRSYIHWCCYSSRIWPVAPVFVKVHRGVIIYPLTS